MAKYTISIEEIIQSATKSQDIILPEQMYTIALNTLFGDEINVIDDKYRKHLVTSFAYHYWLEEIGQESFGRWRMSLIKKIYENSAYINELYDKMDKQLFSSYRVTKTVSNVSVEASAEENSEGNIESNGENTGKITKDGSQETNNSDVTNVSDEKSRNYSDNVANEGEDKTHNVGNSSSKTEDSSSDESHGDNYETGSYRDTNHEESENSGNARDDSNSISIAYNTPQGTLSNLMSPMQVPGKNGAGVGVAYATDGGHVYNYMGSAGEDDSSNVHADSSNSSSNGYSERTFNDYHSKNDNNGSSESSSETTANDESNSSRNYTSAEEKSGESREQGSSESRKTFEGNVTEKSVDVSENKSKDVTTNTNEKKSSNKSETATENESIDYEITFEMLTMSESMMNKIWHIFDSLFMQVY